MFKAGFIQGLSQTFRPQDVISKYMDRQAELEAKGQEIERKKLEEASKIQKNTELVTELTTPEVTGKMSPTERIIKRGSLDAPYLKQLEDYEQSLVPKETKESAWRYEQGMPNAYRIKPDGSFEIGSEAPDELVRSSMYKRPFKEVVEDDGKGNKTAIMYYGDPFDKNSWKEVKIPYTDLPQKTKDGAGGGDLTDNDKLTNFNSKMWKMVSDVSDYIGFYDKNRNTTSSSRMQEAMKKYATVRSQYDIVASTIKLKAPKNVETDINEFDKRFRSIGFDTNEPDKIPEDQRQKMAGVIKSELDKAYKDGKRTYAETQSAWLYFITKYRIRNYDQL